MCPSIDNEVGLAACKQALDRRESYLVALNAYLKLSKLHLNVITQLLTKRTSLKIEVQ